MKYFFIYEYKAGNLKPWKIVIAEEDAKICKVLINPEKHPNDFQRTETPLIKKMSEQLAEYFAKERKTFDLPLILHGTDFQIKVWKTLQTVPYGKTCSYGELAAKTGNPKASRAVGGANNRNQLHIIVPCHRIIGHNGSLTGYAAGLDVKQTLLEIEMSNI